MAKMGDIDLSAFKEFADKIEKLRYKQHNYIGECTTELAQKYLKSVIKLTPVGEVPKDISEECKQKYWSGYSGGTLKGAWRSSSPMFTERGGCKVVISNSEEYASYVEYGHRQKVGRYVPMIEKKLKNNWVEGKYMMTKTNAKIKEGMPRFLDRKLKQFFENGLD